MSGLGAPSVTLGPTVRPVPGAGVSGLRQSNEQSFGDAIEEARASNGAASGTARSAGSIVGDATDLQVELPRAYGAAASGSTRPAATASILRSERRSPGKGGTLKSDEPRSLRTTKNAARTRGAAAVHATPDRGSFGAALVSAGTSAPAGSTGAGQGSGSAVDANGAGVAASRAVDAVAAVGGTGAAAGTTAAGATTGAAPKLFP